MNDSVFFGRHPLISQHGQTSAYRLFVADGADDRRPFGDRELACRRLVSAVAATNFEAVVSGRDFWIPVTTQALTNGLHDHLSAQRTVLTLSPVDLAHPDAPGIVDRARRVGFRIAVDTTDADTSGSESAFPTSASEGGSANPFDLVEKYAVDIDAVIVRLQPGQLSVFRSIGREAARRRLLSVVMGVDSTEQADAIDGDFVLRSGSYFFEPIDGGPAGAVDRLAAMQLLAELEKPNSSFEDVERIIARDPSLVLRMLSLVNSGLFSLPKRIDTTRSALVMLGLRNVRQLALAVTLHSVTSVPPELTLTALIRGRQCELLAAELGVRPEPAFTVGLLSLVGAFAGLPTDEALAALPLTTEVSNAITRRSGLLGEVLDAVLCCESNDVAAACRIVDAISPAGSGPAANVHVLGSTWIQAVTWAERLRADVADVPAPAPVPARR